MARSNKAGDGSSDAVAPPQGHPPQGHAAIAHEAKDVPAGETRSAVHVVSAEAPRRDVVLVNGQTEHGVSIVRLRDERIELGELRAVREGTPVYGELVKLSPRPDHPLLFDAETLVRGPEALPRVDAPSVANEASPPRAVAAGTHKGPPRVTSEAFRSGWDGVFGAKPRKPSLN